MELVIKKSSIEKMGKDLLIEVHEFLHDDYFNKTFPEEISNTKKKFNDYIVLTVLGNDEDRGLEFECCRKLTPEENLEKVTFMIKQKHLRNSTIFDILRNLDLDIEINEDLFFKVEAFLNLYKVFNNDYIYIED